MSRPTATRAAAFLILSLWSLPVFAQFGGLTDFGLIEDSIVFVDAQSGARCGAVNTINADFIVRRCDRRLILLRGPDRETPFVVDENYDVTRVDGELAGRIRFATDNESNRQVFWLSDASFPEGENFVLRYDTDTDQLAVETVIGQNDETISVAPINITQTECDPTRSFDGNVSVLCEDPCGTGGLPALLAMPLVLLAMQRLVRSRPRVRGS